MATEKNRDTSKQQDGSKKALGRASGSQNGDLASQENVNDVSRIDQQEGDMNNGESGGNFSENEKRS